MCCSSVQCHVHAAVHVVNHHLRTSGVLIQETSKFKVMARLRCISVVVQIITYGTDRRF